MADNETPVLEDWEDLPLKVRRNRKHMYEYIKSVLFPEEKSDGQDAHIFFINFRRCKTCGLVQMMQCIFTV